MTSRTVILTAPQGWGKTRNAAALTRELGCKHVIDDWEPRGGRITRGALHLTNVSADELRACFQIPQDVQIVARGWSKP